MADFAALKRATFVEYRQFRNKYTKTLILYYYWPPEKWRRIEKELIPGMEGRILKDWEEWLRSLERIGAQINPNVRPKESARRYYFNWPKETLPIERGVGISVPNKEDTFY